MFISKYLHTDIMTIILMFFLYIYKIIKKKRNKLSYPLNYFILLFKFIYFKLNQPMNKTYSTTLINIF